MSNEKNDPWGNGQPLDPLDNLHPNPPKQSEVRGVSAGSEDDSLLICVSDLQNSAIYDNHVEMQACMRAVAERIKAIATPLISDMREMDAGEREVQAKVFEAMMAAAPGETATTQAPSDEPINDGWNSASGTSLNPRHRAPKYDPTEAEVSALRWLLNITTEMDRDDVPGTREAASLLDDYSNSGGTNRALLESLWSKLAAPVQSTAAGERAPEPVMLSALNPDVKWPHYFDLQVGQRVRTHTGQEGHIATIYPTKGKKYHVLIRPDYGGQYGAWEVTPLPPYLPTPPQASSTEGGV